MEDLAVGGGVGVVTGLGLAGAAEGSLGQRVAIVGGVAGVARGEDAFHFGGSQSRLQQVEDVAPTNLVDLVVALAHGRPNDYKENGEDLHGEERWLAGWLPRDPRADES
ncbi:hypothetical protein RvY_06263 [Ramazzottius varieornatus]|uniref:Uncharacterized protein n=1 Tax=Ramazzottius varieornatus TaxID=947166 RepID=A0A1D1UXX5_RAMVA|nr:hypothetical protein RvY_06263 [Ramazzottius varieornatus]